MPGAGWRARLRRPGPGGRRVAPVAPRTARDRLRSAVGWAGTAGVVAVLVWFGWPSTLGGCTTLTIVSGHSMEPTYYTGDLVVSRCGVPDVDDVVVYTPPDLERGRIIHRVVAGDAESGWVIQGDNNDFLDPWRPHAADVLGIARVHVPGLGRVASILLDPWAWLSLVVVAGGVLLWPNPADRQAVDGPDTEHEPDGPERPEQPEQPEHAPTGPEPAEVGAA